MTLFAVLAPRRYQMQPLPFWAAAAIAGTWLGAAPIGSAAILTVCVCLVVIASFFAFKKKHLCWGMLLIFLMCLLRSLQVFLPVAQLSLPRSAVPITGTVRAVQPGQWGCQATVETTSVNGHRLLIRLICDASLEPRDFIQTTADLSRPETARSPGGFDQSRWLRQQGIGVIAKPSRDQTVRVVQSGSASWHRAIFDALRQWMNRLFNRLFKPESAGLLFAIMTGEKTHLTQAIRMDFVQSGLMHLTAVSGLHLMCLLGPVQICVRRLGLSQRARTGVQIVFLLLFGCLTGWRISVTRAIAMTGMALAGKLLLRPVTIGQSLSVAVIFLQIVQPLSVLSNGFWMSFAATASVLTCSGPAAQRLQTVFSFLPEKAVHALAVVCSAQLATCPFVFAMQGQISVLSLLTNLIAGPLTGLILAQVVLLLIAWPVIAVLPAATDIAHVVSIPLSASLDGLREMAALAARVRPLRIYRSQLQVFGVILLATLIILGIWRLKRNRNAHRNRRLAASVAVLLIGAGCLSLVFQRPVDQIWFFDVGQGDAILLQSQSGESVLIDGGSSGNGYAVLIPALDTLGIDRVNAAIVTHAHEDHSGGLIELADYDRIDQLIIPEGWYQAQNQSEDAADQSLKTLLALCEKRQIPVQLTTAHDTITLAETVRLQVLDPPNHLANAQAAGGDGNAWSLVMLAVVRDIRVLLTGDCTQAAEQRLNRQERWPQADILKVAHHGSARTTGLEMIRQVRPKLAVISVGPNVYGHPSQDVVSRLENEQCHVYRTDRHGTVQVYQKRDCLTVARSDAWRMQWPKAASETRRMILTP